MLAPKYFWPSIQSPTRWVLLAASITRPIKGVSYHAVAMVCSERCVGLAGRLVAGLLPCFIACFLFADVFCLVVFELRPLLGVFFAAVTCQACACSALHIFKTAYERHGRHCSAAAMSSFFFLVPKNLIMPKSVAGKASAYPIARIAM